MKKGSILVLDLGSANIKLVEAEIEEIKTSIKHFSLTSVPAELQKIASVNSPLYVSFLKDLLFKNKISAKNTILCISDLQLELKNLVLPEMSDKELKVSVNWEIKDLINMPIDDAVIDYSVMQRFGEPHSKKIKLSVVALPKKISEEYVAMLNSLGLSPKAFVLEPQAAWSVLKNMPEIHDRRIVAIMNMGAEKTTVSIFENGKLELMRNLQVSGGKFTANIASKVKTIDGRELSIDNAELIKSKYGIAVIEGKPEENINPPDIFAALRPYLEDLVSELARVLEYYKSEHEGRSVELIAFYGGGARMKGISDYISKNIGTPVVLPNPFSAGNVEIESPEKAEIQNLGSFFVNSIGCLKFGKNDINLLPEHIKEQLLIKSQSGKWIKAWTCLIIGLLIVYIPLQVNSWIKQSVLSKLKNRYNNLSVQKSDLDKYNGTVNEFNDKTILCDKLIGDEPFWDDILKELSSLMSGNVVLNKIGFNTEVGGSFGASSLPFMLEGVVYIKGARPEEGVTKFLQNLEKSRYFHRVKLEFSKEGKAGEEKVLEFRIGCEFK